MTAENTPSLSQAVLAKLSEVRAVLRKYVVLHSLLMIACWCLLLFWAGGVIDYMPVTFGASESSVGFRLAVNWLMVLGSAAILVFWTLPRLTTRLKNSSVALLLEKHYPHLDNRLVTAVEMQTRRQASDQSTDEELVQEISNPEAHARMLQRVHESLDGAVAKVEVGKLFDWQPVRAAAVSVTVSAAATLLAIVVMPGWMGLWSKRLFTLSDAPWPRRAELRLDGVEIQVPSFSGQLAAERTSLAFDGGVVRLPKGAAAQLNISANAETKEVPEVCTLFYSSEEGVRGRANLRRIGSPREGWQQFVLDGPPLDGLDSGLRLSVVGLDARLRDLEIEVVDPPLLNNLKLECEYPSYLNSLTRGESETLAYASGLHVPEGTRVVLLGESTTSLSKVEYVVKSVGEKVRAEGEPTGESDENMDAFTPQGLEVSSTKPLDENDRQFRIDLGRLEADQLVELRVFDVFGLPSDQVPRYAISVQADTAPEVDSRLKGIGKAITPLAKLPLEANISDDYEVKEVAAELISGTETSFKVELEKPQDDLLATDLDLQKLKEEQQFELAEGDTLSLVVMASDFFDLGEQEQVGKGDPKTLAVVSEDQLLVLLDRQELEMRQRLEVIIQEIEQLRSAVQSLVPDQAQRVTTDRTGYVAAQDPRSDEERERLERMRVLRAQQSVLQGDKSQQELLGVATGVEDLRQQLQNNRIDSRDRQARLQGKVYQPLVALLDKEYIQLTDDLLALQTAVREGGKSEAQAAIRSVDDVLIKLLEIKENMLDIESFNEIIDLVRDLLEDQESLLKQTEKAKRQKILDLLD